MPPAWRKVRRSRNNTNDHSCDEQRRDRLQQQAVDRGGILQAVIGHRVVGREAGQGEEGQQPGMPSDRRPSRTRCRAANGSRIKNAPLQRMNDKRHRRDVTGDEAAKNDIAGPEQRGERQQQIRLLEQPTACRGLIAKAPASPPVPTAAASGRRRKRGADRLPNAPGRRSTGRENARAVPQTPICHVLTGIIDVKSPLKPMLWRNYRVSARATFPCFLPRHPLSGAVG